MSMTLAFRLILGLVVGGVIAAALAQAGII